MPLYKKINRRRLQRALTPDGRALAYRTGDEGKARLSVPDRSSARESLKMDLPGGISNLVFGDNQRLYASDPSPQIVRIDLDQASVTTLQSKAPAATLDQVKSIDLLHWINGRLFMGSKEKVFARDLVGGVVDKVEFLGAVASLADFGWSDRWLAVTPGNIVRFDGRQRTLLRVGSPAQRYSSVEFSPCGRYLAVALGNVRMAVFE